MKPQLLKLDNKSLDKSLNVYNLLIKKRFLKNKLAKESKLTSKDSLDVLHEFEKLNDGN